MALVRQRIAQAAHTRDRDPHNIRLVAVSKTFPLSHVEAGVRAGLTEFGENRVQEAQQKIERTSELRINWHFIGHLQTNKVRSAAVAFTWIHSVDSPRLLQKLDHVAMEEGLTPDLLVQIDLAGEAAKHGVTIAETRHMFDVASRCQAAKVHGLMLMPPWNKDPEVTRPYFRRLRELKDELVSDGIDPRLLRELSMGMSHDLEVAIQEGATLVRVGTAIFGRRTPRFPKGTDTDKSHSP